MSNEHEPARVLTAVQNGTKSEDLVIDDIPDVDPRHLMDIAGAPERNLQRGLFAGVALKAYRETVHGDGDLPTAISDLLGDLRHLCDAADLDYDALDDRGTTHHYDETHGEG